MKKNVYFFINNNLDKIAATFIKHFLYLECDLLLLLLELDLLLLDAHDRLDFDLPLRDLLEPDLDREDQLLRRDLQKIIR